MDEADLYLFMERELSNSSLRNPGNRVTAMKHIDAWLLSLEGGERERAEQGLNEAKEAEARD